MSRPRPAALALVLAVATVGGCSGAATSEPSAAPESSAQPEVLTLASPDLDEDGVLPEWATATVNPYCTGENRSPELTWTGAPEGVESYVVTLVDTVNDYVHWVVTGIPGDATGLAQAAEGIVDAGVVGANFDDVSEYVGPCAPGRTYAYHLYALDIPVEGDAGTDNDEMLALVEGHVLGHATLDVRRTSPSS